MARVEATVTAAVHKAASDHIKITLIASNRIDPWNGARFKFHALYVLSFPLDSILHSIPKRSP